MSAAKTVDLFTATAAPKLQPEIVAQCSGTLLAGIIHEMACSSADCEGLLFGKQVLLTNSATVTDAAETTGGC